jgi:putative Holliday junction resolvase
MRILGVDYGQKRIGFAVSDDEGILAVPSRMVEVDTPSAAIEATRVAANETSCGRIVVGLPVNMNGSFGPAAVAVRAFAEALRASVSVPVDLWDERLSTAQVEKSLIEQDVSRAKRKKVRDKMAAQVILQGYLDSRGPAECQ